MHKLSSSAVTQLLEIDGVRYYPIFLLNKINTTLQLSDMLGLSYRNIGELNQIIDKEIPRPPRFHCQDIAIGGETVTMYSRDIIECIKALYGSAEFAPHMIYKPERHYGRANGDERHYHDMHTGDWWWEMQVGNHYPPLRMQISILTTCNR
jgi:hypothetical protein